MDYGKLFTRAWETLWKNAFLILLGAIAVLGGGGSGGASQSRYAFQGGDFPWDDMGNFDPGSMFHNWDASVFAIGGIILLVGVLILVGLALWALGLIAKGGLVSGVDDLESGKPTNFISAFQAGWSKVWKLLGIGLVPAIPGLILMVIVISSLAFTGMTHSSNDIRAFAPIIFVICLFVPIMLVVSVLSTFATRACMLEDTGVIASYRRGLEVLGDNLGPALILFVLQVVINIVLGIIFLIPSLLAALCCLLWPLLILIQAAFVTFYSILWTLAWREWVGYPELSA